MKGSSSISFQKEISPLGDTFSYALIIKTVTNTEDSKGLGEGKEILGLNGFKKPLDRMAETSHTQDTSMGWGGGFGRRSAIGISSSSQSMKFEEVYKVSLTLTEIEDLLEAIKLNKETSLKIVSKIGREAVISLKKTKSLEEFITYIKIKG